MKSTFANAPALSHPDSGRQAYDDVLSRLCELASVPPADRDVVLSREAIILDGVTLALQFEVWSGFLKVFIEVGRPFESDALAFYRWVLTQHLAMPAPFSVVAALNPETDNVVLYAGTPLPDSPEADRSFLAFLLGCVHVCKMLRNPPNSVRLEIAPLGPDRELKP